MLYLGKDYDEWDRQKQRRRLLNITILILFLSVSLSGIVSYFLTPKLPDICKKHNIRPTFVPDPKRINERSVLFKHQPYILKNATLMDGDGKITYNTNIHIQNGTIVSIGKDLENWIQVEQVIDLQGRYLTPGLIDVHSHFGTRAQPQLVATEDTNEYVSPATPYVRSIDGINPRDPELKSLLASGVTTHLVLTGSRNILSGESFAIKLHESPNNLVEEMLLQYNVDTGNNNKPVRWFKFAYGENQKLRGSPGYPVSRMGEAWVLRSQFEKAFKLKTQQEEWCQSPSGDYPSDLELNNVVDILRGDMKLNVHLYETYDFETVLRVADEFGVKIDSFHHALSSWEVPKLLKEHNTSIAIFADEWGGKKEQYEATVNAPKILADNGIPVAIKTDHPALPGQDLLYYAQISHNFGLSAELSLASVTSVPAKIMGVDHRIGYVREGYDADICIWNDHPLSLGVKADDVIVDGIPMFNFTKLPDSEVKVTKVKQRVQRKYECPSDFIIVGITEVLMNTFDLPSNTTIKLEESHEDPIVVVKDGQISCIGSEDFCEVDSASDYSILNLSEGYVLPGITALAPSIGLTEMDMEPDTSDGVASSVSDLVYAKDGLLLDGLVIERLQNSGVTLSITAPLGDHFRKGVSTRFSLGEKTLQDAILDEEVAIHFSIGAKAKSSEYPTISTQILKLRLFVSTLETPIPIAVHTHNKAIILQIIQLKRSFPHVNFVIIGGQEAHLIADEIKAGEIPVVLSPWRCTAKFWENRRCSPNPPLEADYSINILRKAGV